MIFSPRAQRFSFLVPLIIVLNIFVFALWSGYADPEWMRQNFLVSADALKEGRWWVMVTSVFSHNLAWHILLNMFVLNSFGKILEQILGSAFFLVFYLFAGVCGSILHVIVSTYWLGEPSLAALGASGAISGLILLFSLMFPKEKILLFAIIPMPALIGAVLFIGLDVWGLFAQAGGGGLPIGHGAHLGGALGGIFTYFFILRKKTYGNI